jgi:hypothetical protein
MQRLLAVFALILWCVASAQSSDPASVLDQFPACAVSDSISFTLQLILLTHTSKGVCSQHLFREHAVQPTWYAFAEMTSSSHL